ncbi:MAG: class I SAM-dependent methyltransferase [Bacteroidota bacterium]
MSSLRDHLLRTLASVPVDSRILDLECADGARTVALAQLGFDVHATASRTEDAVRTQQALDAALSPANTGGITTVDRAITAAPRALGYPDGFFDWVVAVGSYDAIPTEKLADALAETRRVLKPGGWAFVAVRDGADVSPEWLTYRLEAARFAVAEKARRDEDAAGPMVRGIFRKVERDVIG